MERKRAITLSSRDCAQSCARPTEGVESVAVAARRVSLQTKLKICVSYYQIITQLNRVYVIVPPAAYRVLMRGLDAAFHIFFAWIPGVASACTGLGLAHELLLLSLAPIAIVLAAFGVAAVRRQPAVSVLPFALGTSFLCFPFVASRGFRALAKCDCFSYVHPGAAGDSEVCFLYGAYDVQCQSTGPGGAFAAPPAILATAWVAVLLYACAVPLLYALLLLAARRPLSGDTPPTALSRALQFLARDYEPRVFWWELVEVARKICVTGFLALVEPGTLLQLYLGVVVALCILVLQLYAQPYRLPTDNFLSMVSAAALVLTLLGSLGVQMINLKPDLTTLGQRYVGLSEHSLATIAAVLRVGLAHENDLLLLLDRGAKLAHAVGAARHQSGDA